MKTQSTIAQSEQLIPTDFIRQIINADIQINDNQIVTRFPPEPNGYLHIGHAKSICLNFDIAAENGKCYLRFDDTNPSKESLEYVEAIKADIHWLGYDWEEHLRHSSDYFAQIHDFAITLIKMGKAYVCSLTTEQIKEYRGTARKSGHNSPYRDRPVTENLDLFARMRAGEFADGEHVLRAKINMASPNIHLRDPVIYRIKKSSHQMTGDEWCIYPMYDFTHCLSDAIEGITHSLCTLEFEDHRPLYVWILNALQSPCYVFKSIDDLEKVRGLNTIFDENQDRIELDIISDEKRTTDNEKVNINTANEDELRKLQNVGTVKARNIIAFRKDNSPKQIEFARLSLNYMVVSKRKLQELVEGNYVSGWDDPRMPTLIGMRRRGYTPEAIRDFCNRIGITKNDTTIEMGVLENCIRNDLNQKTARVMAVLKPLRMVIENYPEEQVEYLEASNHPKDASMGTRQVPFSRVLYIEQDDFLEAPPKKFFRLAPGREVRLRYAYFITCQSVVKDAAGMVVELRCTYDPATRGGITPPDGRKVKGTIHWVSVDQAINAEIKLYDRLFNQPNPGVGGSDFKTAINPHSMEILPDSKLEPSLANAPAGTRYQFERQGYFCVDNVDSSKNALVFNRIVTLRDSWSKIEKAHKKK